MRIKLKKNSRLLSRFLIRKIRRSKRTALLFTRKTYRLIRGFIKREFRILRRWSRNWNRWLARPRRRKLRHHQIPSQPQPALLRKLAVIILIIGLLNVYGLSSIFAAQAYFNDAEISGGNILSGGGLDFSLIAVSQWEPAEKATNLNPGDNLTRTFNIHKDGSLDFQYNAATVVTDDGGDPTFCNTLELTASLEGVEKYSGSLVGLNFSPSIIIGADGQDDWTFTVNYPAGSPLLSGASCQFKFVFTGWETTIPSAATGFNDSEELENLLEAGISSSSSLSPIADSYVDQNNLTSNNGGNSKLQIQSKSVNENRRTFIRFDFNFPPNTNILSSNLKLYMTDAPAASRSYQAKRVLASWNEKNPLGINWNNQPAVTATVSDTVNSGTAKNLFLSWNVTGDVEAFVAGTANYGWRLADAAENSAFKQLAKFNSREDNDISLQPVLEISFSSPPASTSHMVINEVYYDVDSPSKGADSADEWVELYNPTAAAIDISGWKICDSSSCDTIPALTPVIPAHGFALISKNSSTWDNWVIPAGTVLIALGSNIGGGLNNNGDTVTLKDGADTEIDTMTYSSDGPTVPLSGEGKSLARIVKGYDTDSVTDWIINATPNPGTNPSQSGVEIMRFTSVGVQVAGSEENLPPLGANSSGTQQSQSIAEPSTAVAEENNSLLPNLPLGLPVSIDNLLPKSIFELPNLAPSASVSQPLSVEPLSAEMPPASQSFEATSPVANTASQSFPEVTPNLAESPLPTPTTLEPVISAEPIGETAMPTAIPELPSPKVSEAPSPEILKPDESLPDAIGGMPPAESAENIPDQTPANE